MVAPARHLCLLVVLLPAVALAAVGRHHPRHHTSAATKEDSAPADSSSKAADEPNTKEVHVNLDFNVNMMLNGNKEDLEEVDNKHRKQSAIKKVVTKPGAINIKKHHKKGVKKEEKRIVKKKKVDKKKKERVERKNKNQLQSYQDSDNDEARR